MCTCGPTRAVFPRPCGPFFRSERVLAFRGQATNLRPADGRKHEWPTATRATSPQPRSIWALLRPLLCSWSSFISFLLTDTRVELWAAGSRCTRRPTLKRCTFAARSLSCTDTAGLCTRGRPRRAQTGSRWARACRWQTRSSPQVSGERRRCLFLVTSVYARFVRNGRYSALGRPLLDCRFLAPRLCVCLSAWHRPFLELENEHRSPPLCFITCVCWATMLSDYL